MSSYANNMPPSAAAGAYGMQANAGMPVNAWANNAPAYTSPAYAPQASYPQVMGCSPMPYVKSAPVYAAAACAGGSSAGIILVLFILLVIISRAII